MVAVRSWMFCLPAHVVIALADSICQKDELCLVQTSAQVNKAHFQPAVEPAAKAAADASANYKAAADAKAAGAAGIFQDEGYGEGILHREGYGEGYGTTKPDCDEPHPDVFHIGGHPAVIHDEEDKIDIYRLVCNADQEKAADDIIESDIDFEEIETEEDYCAAHHFFDFQPLCSPIHACTVVANIFAMSAALEFQVPMKMPVSKLEFEEVAEWALVYFGQCHHDQRCFWEYIDEQEFSLLQNTEFRQKIKAKLAEAHKKAEQAGEKQ